MEQSFIAYIENSIKENWDLDALTDYNGATLQYKDVARKIEKVHLIFEASGIKKGDKIAICGRNSSHWGVTFLATLTYGAVAVPILHEFKADNVHNIVNHSEAKLLFVGDQVWENLNESAMTILEGIILMTDFSILISRTQKLDYAREHLNELFGKKYPKNFRKEHIEYHKDQPEELAVINYTSGTTSYSKGVMLPYRSLWSNTAFAFEVLPLKAGDKIISMLPMAHMYGLAFEFLYEFSAGCQIYFLTRMPSPKIIFQAFSEVKPHLVVAVPLIIEKIIKKNVLPKLETPTMKLLLKVPIINDKIKATVREGVVNAFGGRFAEVIVGGAAFNQEVEQFLHMIEFPYTVGYGMTECGPIICYEDWSRFKPGSCGKAVPRMEVKVLQPRNFLLRLTAHDTHRPRRFNSSVRPKTDKGQFPIPLRHLHRPGQGVDLVIGSVFLPDLRIVVQVVKLAVAQTVPNLLLFGPPQDRRQRVAEVHGADFLPFGSPDLGLVPRPVVTDAPPNREVLLVQVDVLPGEGADLPDAKPGVVGDLDGQQGRVVFPFQKVLQSLELLMGESRHSRGVPVLLGEQLVFLFLPPPDHILHGIEADEPLREHREAERPLQDCRILP